MTPKASATMPPLPVPRRMPRVTTVGVIAMTAGVAPPIATVRAVCAAFKLTPVAPGRLAQALIDLCVSTFDLDGVWVKVEFTQHDGNEMYHPHLGGFNSDWTGDERST